MDKEYAKVAWRITDIQDLRPEWDNDQCMEFLITNQKYIQEAMIEHGWVAIETLLDLVDVENERL